MKLFDKLKSSVFWSSVVKLSLGQLIGQSITLVATLVLSRIYTDADYGTYGIITSTAAIIMSIISLALVSAVMVADTDEDSRRIFTVAYALQLFLLVVILIGMLLLAPVKTFFETSIPYTVSVLLMGLQIAISILHSMLAVYVNRLQLTNVLFWNSLINAGCTVFISIPLGLCGFGFIGLLLALTFSELFCSINMMRKAFPFCPIRSWQEIKTVFRDCKRFIFFQYPSNVMGSFSNNLPNQTLYNRFGDVALGAYAMCNKVFNLPLNLIVSPIQTIYFRTAAQMKDQKEQLADFTYGFLKKLMLIALAPMVVCMTFGEYIFGFVLGWQWMEAGLIAAIMCPYFFFWFSYNCITYLRVTIGYQKVNLVMTMLQLVAVLGAIGLSSLVGGGTLTTIIIFSSITTLLSLANIVVSFACLKKYHWKYLLLSALFLLVCCGASCGLRIFL